MHPIPLSSRRLSPFRDVEPGNADEVDSETGGGGETDDQRDGLGHHPQVAAQPLAHCIQSCGVPNSSNDRARPTKLIFKTPRRRQWKRLCCGFDCLRPTFRIRRKFSTCAWRSAFVLKRYFLIRRLSEISFSALSREFAGFD